MSPTSKAGQWIWRIYLALFLFAVVYYGAQLVGMVGADLYAALER